MATLANYMQFNGHATSQDLVSQTLFWASANLSNFPLVDITRNINIGYHEVAVLIQQSDGTWEWDDANNTDLPIATTTLTASQQDYSLSDDHLDILRVEIKDSNGTWHKLAPLDMSDIKEAISDWQENAGVPQYYDKRGRSLFLYPAPNYTQTASLKVFFKRSANVFASTDTTKEPGFSEAFHHILPIKAAKAYCINFKPDRVGLLLKEEERIEKNMRHFYARRDKDEKKRITMARISYL